jgi:hypothetical protein
VVAPLKLFSFSPFWICFADLFFPVRGGRRPDLYPASAVFCVVLFYVCYSSFLEVDIGVARICRLLGCFWLCLPDLFFVLGVFWAANLLRICESPLPSAAFWCFAAVFGGFGLVVVTDLGVGLSRFGFLFYAVVIRFDFGCYRCFDGGG